MKFNTKSKEFKSYIQYCVWLSKIEDMGDKYFSYSEYILKDRDGKR